MRPRTARFTREQHRHADRHLRAPRTRFVADAILDRFERAADTSGRLSPTRRHRSRSASVSVRDCETAQAGGGPSRFVCATSPYHAALGFGRRSKVVRFTENNPSFGP